MKTIKEMRGLVDEELKKRLSELKKERFKLGVQSAAGANPASSNKLKRTKKNIARVLTILREKGVSVR